MLDVHYPAHVPSDIAVVDNDCRVEHDPAGSGVPYLNHAHMVGGHAGACGPDNRLDESDGRAEALRQVACRPRGQGCRDEVVDHLGHEPAPAVAHRAVIRVVVQVDPSGVGCGAGYGILVADRVAQRAVA